MRIIYILLIILLAIKIWEIDIKDRTHPYGLDDKKNKEIRVEGEKYGVFSYWGKPTKKDSIKNSLDKVEWLCTNYTRDVIWRRAFVGSVILTLPLTYIMELTIHQSFLVLLETFIGLYIYTEYDNHHIKYYKSTYTITHIKKIKKKLKISQSNPIYEIL